ncbi:replication initiation protein [Aliarcobacter cryaerophilus]|uniref:Initiator Rep protein WH1 domain-containing protein n=1 Tax=Aliarcobacter cryaerophilus TaxID=28198 RepID=A0A2S9TN69_9BACT|nr:replication initiation protein [Aliarcobacter cryaerophilus]PRN00270.1 hypothetical protein CJ668_07060 [Arcobacter cryaerophilus gv. pseudocryaerophilus]
MSKVEKENLVVKHNALINATSKYKYQANELKLICTLISNIDNQKDKGFDIKYMNLKDLNFSEKDITNIEYITNLCESIMSKPFRIGKGVFNWFSGLVYNDGIIEYGFDKRLKPYLLELKDNFTRYNISNILKLRSSYSIQIFELLSQYKTIGNRTISIDEFRKLLKIPNSYTNKDIRVMIEGVQKDLKKNTTLSFEFSFKKLGKSFNSIDFQIFDNYEHINKIKTQRKAKRLEGASNLSQKMKALKIEDVEI